jgi:hypothetical protein
MIHPFMSITAASLNSLSEAITLIMRPLLTKEGINLSEYIFQ